MARNGPMSQYYYEKEFRPKHSEWSNVGYSTYANQPNYNYAKDNSTISFFSGSLDDHATARMLDHYRKNNESVGRALAHSVYNPFAEISDFLSTLYDDVSPYLGAAIDVAKVVAPLLLEDREESGPVYLDRINTISRMQPFLAVKTLREIPELVPAYAILDEVLHKLQKASRPFVPISDFMGSQPQTVFATATRFKN